MLKKLLVNKNYQKYLNKNYINLNKIFNNYNLINQRIKMSSCLNKSLLGLVAIAVDSTNNNNNNNNINTTHNIQMIVNGSTMTNQSDKVKRPEEAAKIIRDSDVICFDVDSTVIIEEGIDELAKYCGKGDEVSRLTKEAMGGSMTFQEALKIRLDIIKPSQKQIREFLKLHPSTLSSGIRDFINHLRRNSIKVYLISGGFDCLIEPVATELGIPMSNVFANKLMFYYNGEYAGFDASQPTSRSGGKGEAILKIRQQLTNDLNITMIGDGATDLEASPPATNFIGYGGNVIRNEVHNRSQYYIKDFSQLF